MTVHRDHTHRYRPTRAVCIAYGLLLAIATLIITVLVPLALLIVLPVGLAAATALGHHVGHLYHPPPT